jgi:hypothetical protein
MATSPPMATGRASRCARGEDLRRRCVVAPLPEQVQRAQTVVQYRPRDTRLAGVLGLRCGAKTIAHSHVPMQVDPAVQRAFGRQGGAEPSTIARPLQACPAEKGAPLARVSRDDLQREGVTPRPPCPQERLGVEAEVTPRPMGPKAEGRERAWRGRHRRQPGRNPRRIAARASRELGPEPRWRGQAAAVPAVTAALVARETPRGGTREVRQRVVIRLDGGCGPTPVLTGRRSRGSQVVAKIRHRGRVRQWRHQVGRWPSTSSPAREMAAVLAPRRCCRGTRPWGMRTPKQTAGDQEAVWVTTRIDGPPAEVAEASDGRALVEATCWQDQPGVGWVKRRPHRWEAPHLV